MILEELEVRHEYETVNIFHVVTVTAHTYVLLTQPTFTNVSDIN